MAVAVGHRASALPPGGMTAPSHHHHVTSPQVVDAIMRDGRASTGISRREEACFSLLDDIRFSFIMLDAALMTGHRHQPAGRAQRCRPALELVRSPYHRTRTAIYRAALARKPSRYRAAAIEARRTHCPAVVSISALTRQRVTTQSRRRRPIAMLDAALEMRTRSHFSPASPHSAIPTPPVTGPLISSLMRVIAPLFTADTAWRSLAASKAIVGLSVLNGMPTSPGR